MLALQRSWTAESEILLVRLENVSSKVIPVGLNTEWPISFHLAATKAGSDDCKLPLEAPEDQEEATAKDISVDSPVAALLSELTFSH